MSQTHDQLNQTADLRSAPVRSHQNRGRPVPTRSHARTALLPLPFQRPRENRPLSRAALCFPVLENAAAVQLAVMNVIARLLNNQIDTKTAGIILYGLQLASANMGRERELFPPEPEEEEESSCPSLAQILFERLGVTEPSASDPPNFEAPIAAPLTDGE